MHRIGDLLGEAKVGDVRSSFLVDQNVGRFQIAMQQPLAMCAIDRAADDGQQLGGQPRRHGSFGQPLRQRMAADVFHAEVRVPLRFADFVDRDHRRVIELRRCRRLGAKPLAFRRRSELAAQNHLDRHLPIQADLTSAKDETHAPPSHFFEQLVVAESVRQRERQAGCVFGKRLGGMLRTAAAHGLGQHGHSPERAQFVGHFGVLPANLLDVDGRTRLDAIVQVGQQPGQLFFTQCHDVGSHGDSRGNDASDSSRNN